MRFLSRAAYADRRHGALHSPLEDSITNANLLIPGTGGITLMDSEGDDIGWPVLMRLKGIIRGVQGKDDDELIELMSMAHAPGQLAPVRTSLRAGTSLHPGRVVRVAYNQVPSDFNSFLYDWRQDLRHSAGQLLDFLVQSRPTGGKWNLVGHSQGGLLIVLASKLMAAPDDFASLVATVTMVGTPVAGTLNAAQAILIGDNAGARLAPAMRSVIRSWPAIYQMLPTWKSVRKGDGSAAADARQLIETGGWPGISGIQPDLLLRARQVQALLADPLGHMHGVDARFYFAKNRKTPVHIRRPTSGPMTFQVMATEPGDTLVPFRETMLQRGGSALGPFVTAFGRPLNEHAYMMNDPTVVTSLRERLA